MSVGLVLGGRYELRDTLGRGGFGTVWRAHDQTLKRDVAVKLINLDAVGGPDREDVAQRFSREARAVAALNHPNVVTAHDYGVQDGTAYLVMELISGGSLEDEMAGHRGPVDIARAVAVGVQVCAGLAAAHAAGLVHRDLKPANVMNAPHHLVKIVDFGIARIADQSRITHTGSYLGTLRYTSPEQMGAGPIDARADLYSLGCMLFEMMTGRSPYEAQTPVQWIVAHQHTAPASLSAYVADAPPALDALIGRLLAKSPADRPASADAVRESLIGIDTAPSGGRQVTGGPAVAYPTAAGWPSPASEPDLPLWHPPAAPGSWAQPAPSAQPAVPWAQPSPLAPQDPSPPWSAPAAMPYPAPYGGPATMGAWPPPAPGYGAMPGYPSASPPRAIVVAAWLLVAFAILSFGYAALHAVAFPHVNEAWLSTYGQLVKPSTPDDGATVVVFVMAAVAQSVAALLLARSLRRGSHVARVFTFVFVGLFDVLCCVAGFALSVLIVPQDSDFQAPFTSQTTIDAANRHFTDLFPQWLSAGSAVIGMAGIFLLSATAVLIVLPRSAAYFRMWRGRYPARGRGRRPGRVMPIVLDQNDRR